MGALPDPFHSMPPHFVHGGSSSSRAGRLPKKVLVVAPPGPVRKLVRPGASPLQRLPRPAAGSALGADGDFSISGLATQLLFRTFTQVTGPSRRKKVVWVYDEPAWAPLVILALVIIVRYGAGSIARRLWLLWWWWKRAAKDALPPTPPPTMANIDIGPEAEKSDSVATSAAGGPGGAGSPDPSTSVRGQAPKPTKREFSSAKLREITDVISAAEAPLILCLLASVSCHIMIAFLRALQNSGHSFVAVAETILRVWIAQLCNYTITAGWLVQRILNKRLDMSKSRPTLSGDLSALMDSAGATSRRFAQEAALTSLVNTIVTTVCGLLVLRHLGINVQRVLVATSLSGVAFSFFIGDILSNLFGGFVLYLTQPFAQGDWVQTPDGKLDGWIQTMGWYYITLMRWDKRPQYIPNSNFSFLPIVNCSRMTHRRILIEGPLRIKDLDKIEDILAECRNLVENHNDIDKSMHQLCRLKRVEDYSAVVWISCYTRNITLAKFLEVQESLLLGMFGILKKYKTTWATSLERFPISPGGDAELTNESRRVLALRDKLSAHEGTLDEKAVKIAEEMAKVEALATGLQDEQRDFAPVVRGLKKLKELVSTTRRAVEKREMALQTKQDALKIRAEAVKLLEGSLSIVKTSPAEAVQLKREALELREESVRLLYLAAQSDRNALEITKEVLDLEQQLGVHMSLDLSEDIADPAGSGLRRGSLSSWSTRILRRRRQRRPDLKEDLELQPSIPG